MGFISAFMGGVNIVSKVFSVGKAAGYLADAMGLKKLLKRDGVKKDTYMYPQVALMADSDTFPRVLREILQFIPDHIQTYIDSGCKDAVRNLLIIKAFNKQVDAIVDTAILTCQKVDDSLDTEADDNGSFL